VRLRRREGELAPGGFGPADESEELEARLPAPMLGGWLLANRGYSRVEVRVGDRPPVRARLFSMAQPALARAYDDPGAPMAGWTVGLDLGDLEPGSRFEVTATAFGEAGELELGSARVVTTQERPTAVPDPVWVRTLAARASADAAGHLPGAGLRLLAFTHDLGLGGGQLYLEELVRHLLRGPDTTCTVIAPADGPLRHRLEQAGAAVHLAAKPGQGDAYECHLRDLVRLARDLEASAVIANTAHAFHGVDLAHRLGIPSLWAIHESMSFDQLLYGADWTWADDHVAGRLRAALDLAGAVLFEADATRDLFSGLAADPSRLIRLDYGIELEAVDRSRRELDRDRLREANGIGPDERVVLCPGVMEPRKGQILLALAFARLAAEFGDATLVIVGKSPVHGDYVEGAEEVIRRLGLPDGRIRIERVTPDLHEWFAVADAIVVASDIESLPRVIMEAMAFGLPVLATRVFGIPELIEDGVNGLLCEPQDIDSLTDGLRRLLSLDREESERIGHAGEATVRPERDAARYAEAVRGIFESLMAETASSADPLG
jgi:glycosyltransferase involved in cell wall biosynthesis